MCACVCVCACACVSVSLLSVVHDVVVVDVHQDGEWLTDDD